MGEVKEAVKGTGKTPSKRAAKKMEGNLIDQIITLRDEVGQLTAIKDDETVSEGKDAYAENTRKAALLRSTYSLLSACKTILEDY